MQSNHEMFGVQFSIIKNESGKFQVAQKIPLWTQSLVHNESFLTEDEAIEWAQNLFEKISKMFMRSDI